MEINSTINLLEFESIPRASRGPSEAIDGSGGSVVRFATVTPHCNLCQRRSNTY